jgi:hypothetical protein
MRHRVVHIAGIAAAIVASFAAAVIVLPQLPAGKGPGASAHKMPEFSVPPDAFFISSTGDELSQMVLYHGLGDSIDHARQADILFVGDSRMPLGLREGVIVPEAQALGLRVFSLACGHVERVRFALDLIRKHDLRPRLVVVAGGPHVFEDVLSKPAEKAEKLTRWQAWNAWTEAEAAWAIQRRLHAWLPKVDWLGPGLAFPWIIYRSSRTGWWLPVREPEWSYPIGFDEEARSYENLLPMARELKEELDRRGAGLVLTVVPYGNTRWGHLAYLARELGVPTVVPGFDGMFTSDGSHLNRASADRYSSLFWQQFIALPEVRSRLARGG